MCFFIFAIFLIQHSLDQGTKPFRKTNIQRVKVLYSSTYKLRLFMTIATQGPTRYTDKGLNVMVDLG